MRRALRMTAWCAGLAAACAQPAQRSAPAAEPEAHAPGRVPPPGPYAPGFDVQHYRVAIGLSQDADTITGRAALRIAVVEPRQDRLRLDLTGLRVFGVTVAVAGARPRESTFTQRDGRVWIPVPSAARAGDTLAVEVVYGGRPDDGLILRANVHGKRGAFGDNWPDRARFWFPSIDHPGDKATVEFEVKAPRAWEVIANGHRQPPADAPGEAAFRVWRSSMREPIPTYLMVIGATDFAIGTVSPCARGGRSPARADDCVPVTYWVFPEDSANGARVFRRADDMLRYDSELIAPYPYARLDHVQSATRFGGMENATAIFYSERAIAQGTLGEGTVSHEIAHQWFGNAVTPARWSDLWLSEGFATYFGMLYFEAADGAERFREMRMESWNEYLRSDVTRLAIVDTLRVPDNDLLALLNANSYNKGGAVLHMLRGLLGDAAFFDGIRRYYEAHVHGTAVTADLQRALEATSGRDLSAFFEQWVYRPGHPVLSVTHTWDAAAREAVVTIEQTQAAMWPVFRVPLTLEFETGAGTQRRVVELRDRRTVVRVALTAAPSAITVDPEGWILKEMSAGR